MTNEGFFWDTLAPSEADASVKVQVVVRTDCPDPALLRAEQAGVLPPDLAAMVTAHVVRCRVCQILQADLATLDPDPISATEAESLRLRILLREP